MGIKARDKNGQLEIQRSMKTYERFTCIRYVPWENDNGTTTNDELELGHQGHLKFVARGGCWSYQGNQKWSGGQTISCCGGSACVHELGHALGVYHEQQSPNPDRNWWIRVNYQYITDDWYSPANPANALSYGYDMSSYMHYETWMFGTGEGPTFSRLFPELREHNSHYYLMMEVSVSHKCDEMKCPDSTMVCENDGYLTVVDGKCGCRCLPGLDPDTGCTTVYKNDPPSLTFPGGQYALPQPAEGCPSGSFAVGSRTHYNDGGNTKSSSYDLKGDVSGEKVEHHFCVSNSAESENKWPTGNYCIYRKGDACPDGFTDGFVQYDDNPTEALQNSFTGELPAGVFDDDTRFEFCCRRNGFSKDELFLPSRNPLVLMKQPNNPCHKIRGMHAYVQSMKIDNSESDNVTESGGTTPISRIDDGTNAYTTEYCYYKPAMIDCGDVIELSAANPTVSFTSPVAAELECYWHIKAPQGETIQLDFDSFSVRGSQGSCVDEVEIRYARPGQPGVTFCGDRLDKSIRSINNTIHIRMSTYGNSGNTDSQISATATLIQNSELCYDVADRGTTYAGTVNFVNDFEPCLPWKDVAHCPYHTYNVDALNTMLVENYCRNPDYNTGIMPWCYTDAQHCARKYCDVCLNGKRFDLNDDCSVWETSGQFCTSEMYTSMALKQCAKTCETQFPNPEVPVKVGDITCGQPGSVPDGTPVSTPKDSYSVGETVTYKCNYHDNTRERTCLTSGEWSVLGFVCAECPDGWHVNQANGHCYGLIETRVDQPTAVSSCVELGAILSPAVDQAENDFIMDVAGGQEIWLGIDDTAEEGTWVFTDGVVATWTNWDSNQPDNWGSGEDCANIRTNRRWNDLPCSPYTYQFVCKKPLTALQNCLDFWDQCDELFAADPNICTNHTDFAHEQCAYTCGICEQSSTSECTVDDIPPNASTQEQRTTISRGEAVSYTCNEGFVQVGGDKVRGCQASGTLSGAPISCVPGCESGWTFNEETQDCYRYFTDAVTYDAAIASCASYNGIVATIKSLAQFDFIGELRNSEVSMWLGLDDRETEGLFRWADGQMEVGWSNWNGGEPNDWGTGEDCGHMRTDGKWNDIGCDYSFSYVCQVPLAEIQATSAPATTTTTTTQEPTTTRTTTEEPTTTTTTAEPTTTTTTAEPTITTTTAKPTTTTEELQGSTCPQ